VQNLELRLLAQNCDGAAPETYRGMDLKELLVREEFNIY
jgi:hypothetical protein